jgi:competence protein ComEC
MNGLLPVLRRFNVTTLWTSGDDGKNPVYAQLLSLAKAHEVLTPVPFSMSLGGLQLIPLGPFVGDAIGPPEGVSVNDASLVVRAAFGGRHILFAGDVEAQGEAELLGRAESGWSIDADILKVPHHGSRTSSSAALLASVHPCWAVASLGFDNRFGFPHREVTARYAAANLPLLRTDRNGAVSFTVTPEGRISSSCVRGGACALVSPVEAEAAPAPCRAEGAR